MCKAGAVVFAPVQTAQDPAGTENLQFQRQDQRIYLSRGSRRLPTAGEARKRPRKIPGRKPLLRPGGWKMRAADGQRFALSVGGKQKGHGGLVTLCCYTILFGCDHYSPQPVTDVFTQPASIYRTCLPQNLAYKAFLCWLLPPTAHVCHGPQ